jgi:hypothetical protein
MENTYAKRQTYLKIHLAIVFVFPFLKSFFSDRQSLIEMKTFARCIFWLIIKINNLDSFT